MASFEDSVDDLFEDNGFTGNDQLGLEGEARETALFYDDLSETGLALPGQSVYPDLDTLNDNSYAFINPANQPRPEPLDLALPPFPPLPLVPAAEGTITVDPLESALALLERVTNTSPHEHQAEPEVQLQQQHYNGGKRVPPKGSKISHSRDKKDGRGIEDYDWYEPMPARPSWEAGNGTSKTTIAYEKTGQLKHGLRFDQTTLERYLRGCREQRIPLRLWVQEAPTMHAERFQANNHRCRSVYCEFHTISRGEYQVSFDEHPDETSNGRYDPFHVAGYMHLFCLEKLMPLAALIGGGLADVRADLRMLPLEEKNPMSLARDDSDSLRRAFSQWVCRYVTDFHNLGLVVPYSNDIRSDCHTLRNYLTRAKIMNQPEARQRKRNQRGGIDIAQHLGNLDRKAAMLEEKKERRKQEKKRKARREAVGRGSSDEGDVEDCVEVKANDGLAKTRLSKRVCTPLRNGLKATSPVTESKTTRRKQYQKLQRQQRQQRQQCQTETPPQTDLFQGDCMQGPSLSSYPWMAYDANGGQCVVQPVDGLSNCGQILSEPMPNNSISFDPQYQPSVPYQQPPSQIQKNTQPHLQTLRLTGELNNVAGTWTDNIGQPNDLDQLSDPFFLGPDLFQSTEHDGFLITGNALAIQADGGIAVAGERRVTRSMSRAKAMSGGFYESSVSAAATESNIKNEDLGILKIETVDLGKLIDPALLAMDNIDPTLLETHGSGNSDSKTENGDASAAQALALDLGFDYPDQGLDFGAIASASPEAGRSNNQTNDKQTGPLELPSLYPPLAEGTRQTDNPEPQQSKAELYKKVDQLETLVEQLTSQIARNGAAIPQVAKLAE